MDRADKSKIGVKGLKIKNSEQNKKLVKHSTVLYKYKITVFSQLKHTLLSGGYE